MFAVGLFLTLVGSAAVDFAPPKLSATNVPVEPGVRRETLAEGLEHPWGMAFLPNGKILVTERPGRVRLISKDGLSPTPVSGAPQVFASGQGGLLDIALHPKFSTNKWVYFTHAIGTTDANRTALSRAKLNLDTAEGPSFSGLETLFEVSQTKRGGQHFGSRLAWREDGALLMSIGDGGNPPSMIDGKLARDYAQDPSSQLGKILLLTEDGKPAVGKTPVFSMGHRNIQGLLVDPARKAIWATEHGSLGGDELNRIEPNGNYGWPVASQTREYRGGAPIGDTTKPGMKDPVLLWEVAVAPSGLALYRGNAFPQWRGDLFSGSLMSQDVRRIDLNEHGDVTSETAIRIGQRVRDIKEGPDGNLYVLTDEKHGRLLKLSPDPAASTLPPSSPGSR